MSSLNNIIKTFFRISFQAKILVIRVFILTAISRFAMKYIDFCKLKKYMGQQSIETSYEDDKNYEIYLKRLSFVIQKVAKYTPWESKCLVQALTAQHILHKKKLKTTLYLGVNKENNELIAHAWIRCGSFYVTGGDGENYGVVAKFSK